MTELFTVEVVIPSNGDGSGDGFSRITVYQTASRKFVVKQVSRMRGEKDFPVVTRYAHPRPHPGWGEEPYTWETLDEVAEGRGAESLKDDPACGFIYELGQLVAAECRKVTQKP